MTVRRALPADAAALAEVAGVTFVLACPPSTAQEAIDDFIATALSEAAFGRYLADPARTLLVAESAPGAPFDGYTMLVSGDPVDADVAAAVRIRPTAELSKIYVREGSHGRGTARELLMRTIDAAREGGAAGIWLGTNEENVRAQRFYAKHGFERIGTKRFKLGDRYEHDLVFERPIGPRSEEDGRVSDPAWFTSAVVYQIYPRSFADSDGDGIGDLGGVLEHVDHLATLGVDVVWLSPIYSSPQADNGYDISDYEDIDPLFGTLEQLDELIAALHARGIKLVMDLVVNHTSDEHAWFRESAAGRDSAKRDWYVWRDPRDPSTSSGGPGQEPNNWGSFFSGSAWQWHEASGQYYLHLFDRKQPDLNWENEDVREAIFAMMRRWLDRGVDGFRMDVINFISKDPSYADGPPVAGREHVNAFQMFADGPRVHEFLAEMHEQVFAGREGSFLTVGEMPGVTPEEAVLYTDPDRGEVDMVFQFEHVSIDQGPTSKFDHIALDRVSLKRSLHRWQTALAAKGWNSLYWDNHDQPRAVSRFGDDDPAYWEQSAKALATILHGMRGTPYVYQGEELGMTNYPFRSAAEHRDVEAVNFWKRVLAEGLDQQAALTGMAKSGRDNARTPMQWDASPTAGFTTGEAWLPVNPNRSWLNATAQVGKAGSVFEHYRALIALRHEHSVIAIGDFTGLLENDQDVWAYVRTAGRQKLLVVANCSRQPRELELGDGWSGARLLLGSVEGRAAALAPGPVTLAGWESRIYLQE